MRTLLLSLLALSLAGSLAKADSLNYKYTWHIDGVVLPDDGLRLPSIELAFLAGNDLFFGPAAIYNFNETGNNVVPLYLRESVGPNSPNYINPFQPVSGFQVGAGQDCTQNCGGGDFIVDDSLGAGYNTFGIGGVDGEGTGTIYGYSYSAGDPERALTTETVRFDIVPEPRAASLLALGLVGIIGLAMWRKKAHFAGNGDIGKNGV